jgi:hypothetical protein
MTENAQSTPEFAFELTRGDLLAFLAHSAWRSPTYRRNRLPLLWIGPVALAAVLLTDPSHYLIRVPLFVIGSVAWVVFQPRWFAWMMVRSWNRLLDSGPMDALLGTHRAAFKDGVLTCAYPGGYNETRLASIIRVDETPEHFFLYQTTWHVITLPRRTLPPEVEAFIRARWPK